VRLAAQSALQWRVGTVRASVKHRRTGSWRFTLACVLGQSDGFEVPLKAVNSACLKNRGLPSCPEISTIMSDTSGRSKIGARATDGILKFLCSRHCNRRRTCWRLRVTFRFDCGTHHRLQAFIAKYMAVTGPQKNLLLASQGEKVNRWFAPLAACKWITSYSQRQRERNTEPTNKPAIHGLPYSLHLQRRGRDLVKMSSKAVTSDSQATLPCVAPLIDGEVMCFYD
jgi:hypothetical protein